MFRSTSRESVGVRHPFSVSSGNHRPVGMAHLLRYPHRMLSSREHHAGIGVPGLVRVAVAHPAFLQCPGPQRLANRLVARPSRLGLRILKHLRAGKSGVLLLCL